MSHYKEAINVFQHDETELVPQGGSRLPVGGDVVKRKEPAIQCLWQIPGGHVATGRLDKP